MKTNTTVNPSTESIPNGAQSDVFSIISLNKGQTVKYSFVDKSVIVFLLQGQLNVTSICIDGLYGVKMGEMFLMPRCRTYHFYATENSSVFFCSLNLTIAFCQKHPIGEFYKYLKFIPEEMKRNKLGVLPIRSYLWDELIITQKVLENHLDYEDFQQHKRDILFLYIRYLYTDVEKTYMFRFLVNEDMRFLAKVLEIYYPDITAQEFIQNSGMSASTFNRKFRNAFNVSVGKWLIKKKCESVLEDLTMSNLSIHDIAEKHRFTPNHLTKFCKTYFSMSPTEIRENQSI